VAIGLSFGLGWGLLAQWLPSRDSPHCAFFRWLILFGGGLIALYGAHLIHYDGAGGLAAIILAFVAAMQWRREGWGDHNPVSNAFTKMWIILEPIIFALIGTEIQVDKIDPAKVGLGVLVLLGALLIRMIGTFFAVTCGSLNTKEKIFMAFAWMPKATVQAALGPIFLDNAIKYGKTEWIPIGEEILTLAVLSILITAPLGAVAILALGPKLLDDGQPGQEDKERGEERRNGTYLPREVEL
jgi:NhaP-type Na+/H+ or K+/H+ antiporter